MSQQLLKQVREISDIHSSYLERARNLSHEQLNKRPSPDQWSLAQALHHLSQTYNLSQAFMERRLEEKKVNTDAGWKNMYRSFLLQLALYLPFKFKAPRAAGEVPAEARLDELESSFNQTTKKLEQLIGGLPAALEDKEIFKHPVAGYLNAGQTLSFIKAHALHHKPQIENLLKTV